MRFTYRKITIISSAKEPKLNNVDQELQWLGTSLGLIGLRDKDRSCYRIFVTLIKALKSGQGLTSDELAYQLNLSRGTVVHHLNNLLSAGIIIERNNRYLLRDKNLKAMIENIKKDTLKTYDNLNFLAENIDDKLGL